MRFVLAHKAHSGILKWLEKRLPVVSLFHSEFVVYPTPRNLNYWWAFGAILTFILGAPRGVRGGHERDGIDDPIRELRFSTFRMEIFPEISSRAAVLL